MKKILFLLFISSSLLALDNDSKGLMCEGADNKDKNRLDEWNSFEYLIIDSNEKKYLNELYEVISIYQHTICGFQKHDAKITSDGFLFYGDTYIDCLNGSCNRTLRCMYTFDDSFFCIHLLMIEILLLKIAYLKYEHELFINYKLDNGVKQNLIPPDR